MKNLKKQLSVILSTTLLSQALSVSAFGAGLQCTIVHDELRLGALQTLSQDQRTSLKTTLWQRLLNGKALNNFSVDKYKQSLSQLLAGEKAATDQELWQSVEGKLALIEFLNITSKNSLNIDDMLSRLENLQAFSQRKMMKMVDVRLDSNSFLSNQFLDQFGQDFFLLLRGAKVSTLDYLTMNSDARAKKQLGGLMQEELLTYGLKGVLSQMGVPEATIKDRIVTIAHKVLRVGLGIADVATLSLPEREPVQMSEELMTKVLLDGADAHQAEIDQALAPQLGKNRYEVARRWLRPVLSVALILYFHTGGEIKTVETQSEQVTTQLIQTRQDQDRAQVSAQLQSVRESMALTSAIYGQERYLDTLDYIQQKWKKAPNSSQMQTLLTEIYGRDLSQQQIQNLVKEVYQGQAESNNIEAMKAIPSHAKELILTEKKG